MRRHPATRRMAAPDSAVGRRSLRLCGSRRSLLIPEPAEQGELAGECCRCCPQVFRWVFRRYFAAQNSKVVEKSNRKASSSAGFQVSSSAHGGLSAVGSGEKTEWMKCRVVMSWLVDALCFLCISFWGSKFKEEMICGRRRMGFEASVCSPWP